MKNFEIIIKDAKTKKEFSKTKKYLQTKYRAKLLFSKPKKTFVIK